MPPIITTTQSVDLLDAILNGMDIETLNVSVPVEEQFVNSFVGGKLPKMNNMIYIVREQINLYHRFNMYSMQMCSPAREGMRPVTIERVGRVMIEHFLMSYFAHWFVAGERPGKVCNMENVLDRLMMVPQIKSMIFAPVPK